MIDPILDTLPIELITRLNLIVQTIPMFWEQRIYQHFTNHGTRHSERVFRIIAQLAAELPTEKRLSSDEIFLLSAAAFLYEIGMQTPYLRPILDFDYIPGETLTHDKLMAIRTHKHLLSHKLILDFLQDNNLANVVPLGILRPADQYSLLIADLCRWCFDGPIYSVDKSLPVQGREIRVQLLVALLRLADQLYFDSTRVRYELLNPNKLSISELVAWETHNFVQNYPIVNGQIRFHYNLPVTQMEYLGFIRAFVEQKFGYEKNQIIRYLWKEHNLRLTVSEVPSVTFLSTAIKNPIRDVVLNFLTEFYFPKVTIVEEIRQDEGSRLKVDEVLSTRQFFQEWFKQFSLELSVLSEKLDDTRYGVMDQVINSEKSIIDNLDTKFDTHQSRIIQVVLEAIETRSDIESELGETLTVIQEIVEEVRIKKVEIPDANLKAHVENLSQVVIAPELSVGHKLKVAVPIIPFFITYEGEIELKSAANLEEVWKRLIKKIQST